MIAVLLALSCLERGADFGVDEDIEGHAKVGFIQSLRRQCLLAMGGTQQDITR